MEIGVRPWLLGLPMPPRVRGWAMRAFGATVGGNVRVHPLRVMNVRWSNLTIADDCYIGPDVLLDLADRIDLGRGVVIAGRASLWTHQDAGESHGSPAVERVPSRRQPLTIGEHAFVGAGAIVLCGASLGSRAVVGAGAVVTRPVADGVTVTGVPAR